MRMLKKFLRILAILLPAFLGVLFLTNNTHAVSDYTFTYDSSNSSTSPYICGNNSGVNCSDYTYIIIQSEDTGTYSPSNPSIAFYMEMNVQSGVSARQYNQFYEMSPRIVITIPANGIRSLQVWTIGSLTRTVTIILTNTACPACEECQPIPENPYDQKFDDIKKAIYVSCATILVIYFFYMIYGIIIKPTGGER